MSNFTKKYNKKKLFTFEIPEEFEYKSLADLYEESKDAEHPVNALYINTKGLYDDSPVVATDTCMVNLPSHLTKTVNEMLEDDQLVSAINNGEFGFKIYTYTYKSKLKKDKGETKTAYSVEWVDL